MNRDPKNVPEPAKDKQDKKSDKPLRTEDRSGPNNCDPAKSSDDEEIEGQACEVK